MDFIRGYRAHPMRLSLSVEQQNASLLQRSSWWQLPGDVTSCAMAVMAMTGVLLRCWGGGVGAEQHDWGAGLVAWRHRAER